MLTQFLCPEGWYWQYVNIDRWWVLTREDGVKFYYITDEILRDCPYPEMLIQEALAKVFDL